MSMATRCKLLAISVLPAYGTGVVDLVPSLCEIVIGCVDGRAMVLVSQPRGGSLDGPMVPVHTPRNVARAPIKVESGGGRPLPCIWGSWGWTKVGHGIWGGGLVMAM